MSGGKGGSAPKSPNPATVIPLEGAENRKTALATSMLFNPNVSNPYGTQKTQFTIDPTTGNYIPNTTQTYSPSQQAIFNQEQALQQKLGAMGNEVASDAASTLSQPLNFDSASAMPGDATATRDKVMAAMMGRVNEDTGKTRDQLNSELIAAGIPPGSKAYADRMALVDRGYNDARNQAFLASGAEASRDFGMGMQGRQQGITEILAQRQQPLNEINALRTGSQVAPLQFSGVQGSAIKPPDVAGAYQNQYMGQMDAYNAKVGQQNATMNTIGSLAGAGMMATGMF